MSASAALASRLVCRQWRALGDHALATTLIRLRLLSRQVKAAMYTRFLVKSMPASAHQLQRSGRPGDATAAQLASSQEEFMVAAYENCYSPVVITSADAAVELIRHLRKHGVHTPFVVFAAPKKLAAWQRYLQSKFTGRVSVFASQADFVDVDWRLQEGAIVSYAAAAYWPKRLVRLSYVILDDVRTYMWRPTFTHLFDRKGHIFQKNYIGVPSLRRTCFSTTSTRRAACSNYLTSCTTHFISRKRSTQIHWSCKRTSWGLSTHSSSVLA